MKENRKFRFLIFLRNSLIILMAAFLLWVGIHTLMTKYEKEKFPALGQLVEVDGEKIHVLIKGEGKETIVLLPGLGTAAPVLDYEPLMDELAKNHKVVVVEPFGYGWSELTNKERTVENIVEEIRMALQEAGINGPYTLMPHSISGIYCMYYANNYPEEIRAIIGIDFTLPQAIEYFEEPIPTLPSFLQSLAPIGIIRAAILMTPNSFLPIAEDQTFSNENIKLTKLITAWKAYNKNVIMEAEELANNIEKTKNMTIPTDIPVLIFTTEEEKVNKDGKSNVTFYREQLKGRVSSTLVTLKAHHYIHWTEFNAMSKSVNEFLKNQ